MSEGTAITNKMAFVFRRGTKVERRVRAVGEIRVVRAGASPGPGNLLG